MTNELELKKLQKNGVRFFLISFADLNGIARSKLVPAQAMPQMVRNGAGFAGFASYFNLTPADPDVLAYADLSRTIQLPWNPEVAWVPAVLKMNGKTLEQCPRSILIKLLENTARTGYQVKTGVECEFFLLNKDTKEIYDSADSAFKPCYDQNALMRQYKIIARAFDYMGSLGWEPYQADHEDANGQFEINWKYSDALTTSDRHMFFRYMMKSLAEEEGFIASFMPKPFSGLTGNGAHIHLSMWNNSETKNTFMDSKGDLGLSQTAYHFIGGVLKHAQALAAFSNPTVNSYKRINAGAPLSGATWSPNTITFGGNNRTHMIRIPDNDRLEIRLPDSAINPYLTHAALIISGLEGISKKINPGKRHDIDMYKNMNKDLPKLPLTLAEALNNLDQSHMFRKSLGNSLVDSYLTVKRREWTQYMSYVSSWELKAYL